jgi:hypothetical protein
MLSVSQELSPMPPWGKFLPSVMPNSSLLEGKVALYSLHAQITIIQLNMQCNLLSTSITVFFLQLPNNLHVFPLI